MRAPSRVAIWGSALAVAAFEVVGTFGATSNQPERKDVTAVALALVLIGPAALAVRDRFPRAVAATAIGSTLVYLGLGYAYGPVFVSVVVALVWLVLLGRRREAWGLAGAGYAGFLATVWVDGRPGGSSWVHWALVAGWLVVVLVVADQARIRRDQRVVQLQADRDARERQAGKQRLALAQELHDVLAHNISLVNVQASVALHLLDEQPDRARPALTAIKQASHDALEGLRTALDLLRDGDAPKAPAPRLRDLGQLVDGVRGGGLTVRLDQEPEPPDVPAAVQLAAYRIVQEALTNVTRHAGASAVVVTVGYADGVTIEVQDDGVGGVPVSGNGLSGMRERATALGGSVEAGPVARGGFLVRAHLPVRS
jgi:signal transduction histidine kinase